MNGSGEVTRQSKNNAVHSKDPSGKEIQLYQLLSRLVIRSLEGKPIADGALDKVKDQVGEVSNIYDKYAALSGCIRAFLRQPPGSVKADTLRENLKAIKMPEESLKDMVNMLCGPQRERLDENASKQSFFMKLERFRWRIDITISSSVLSRVLEPTILFEMQLSNGKCQTYEVTITKFHELRYTIASILKEMETIEKKKLIKKSITQS